LNDPVAQTAPVRRELRLFDLVFFNICALVSLRWVAAAAHSGPGSLVLWVVAALFFFLPSALIVAALSRRFPQEGGMYIWTKEAFGDRHAFLCAWFYFLSTVLYFPSLLLAGIGMTAFAAGGAGQSLAEDRTFAIATAMAVLWAIFITNFFGIRVAKWISAFGGISTFVIGALIIALGIVAAIRSGAVTKFDLLPRPSFDTLNFWSQIAFAFIGLELAPVLSGEIQNPTRDIPRAAVISGVVTMLFYVAATTSLLTLLRPAEISPMTGLAQAGVAGASRLGVPFVSLLLAILIGLALLGQLDTWVAGNTRLPYAIGLDNYLPSAFKRVHPRWGTPYVSLFAQAAAATVFLLMAEAGASVRAAYQILVDMMVMATFIPFLYIFGAGFRFANRIAAASGLTVTVIAIILTALPPEGVGSALLFEAKILGGTAFFAALGWLIFKRYESRRSGTGLTPGTQRHLLLH
jgi:amino acid transporter